MKFTLFLLIFLTLSYSCGIKKTTHQTLSTNSNHEQIRWNQFPISFYFDPTFPEDKKRIFQIEAAQLNLLVGKEVIHLNSGPIPPEDSEDTNYNVTIARSADMPFGPKEEAKTVTVEHKNRLIAASIFYNPAFVRPDYDFASVTRHELCHALGIKHIGTGSHGLMAPYQEAYQIKEWDTDLIESWKQEMALAD